MSNAAKNNRSKKKKWLLIGITLLLFFVVGRLALKSDWIFSYLKTIAETQISERINGSLQIGNINGDLLRGFVIREAVLTDLKGDTVVGVDSVSLSYSLISLLKEPYTLNRLQVTKPQIFVKQNKDSVWNVQMLLPESDNMADESTTQWAIDSVWVKNAHITAESELMFPDQYVYVDSLTTQFSAGTNREGFYGHLDQLDFQLREKRLPEPIAVYLSGSGSSHSYTLESLVLNTGRTFLKGRASVSAESELNAEFDLNPLSTIDINNVLDSFTFSEQDMEIRVGAEGTLKQFTVNVRASAKGLQRLDFSTQIDMKDGFRVKNMRAEIDSLDVAVITGDSSFPSLQTFRYQGTGEIRTDAPDRSEWVSMLSMAGLKISGYEVDQISSPVNFSNGILEVELTANYSGETVTANVSGSNLFSNLPEWNADINGNGINLANWLQDPVYESDLNLKADIKGSGSKLNNFQSDVDVVFTGNDFQNQPFDQAIFKGKVGSEKVSGTMSFRINRSIAEASLLADQWLAERPQFSLNASIKEFNLANLNGLEALPTYLNGSFEAEGAGKTAETLDLIASAELDSSVVNGEEIKALHAAFKIHEQFITIEKGNLESSIASADFSVRQHLKEFANPENRAEITAAFHNLRPLAPLFGYENIEAKGTLSLNAARNSSKWLQFDGEADIRDVVIDTLFSSEVIAGEFNAEMSEVPEVNFTASLEKSALAGISIQDVDVRGSAHVSEDKTDGSVELLFSDGAGSHLRQAGRYSVTSESTLLTTEEMDFKTDLRSLTLKKPFELRYSGQTVQMDTLSLTHSDDEAYLKLWISRIDSLQQVAGMDVKNLDLGQLQQTLLGESYLDGHLSGRLDMANSPEELWLRGNGHLANLQYRNGIVDSVNVSASINNEWLEADLGAWHNGGMIAESDIKVPYLPGDPLTFEEQFFERDVEGSFNLYSTELSYWFSFLPDGGPAETSGVITLEGNLNGVAGHPEITGDMSVFAGVFSGISTDYMGVGFNYIHDDQSVDLKGSVIKNASSILSFESTLPFTADLKRAELLFPKDSDSLKVKVKTEDFNLALFNSYVDQQTISNISGVVEGDVSVYGTLDDLKTEGGLEIKDGSFRAVQPAITLDQLNSSVSFQPERVSLDRFSVRSGPGRLEGSGSVTMDDLKPGSLDVNINARQFRIVNNRDMNALVNMAGSLKGTFEKPEITGQLEFITGLLNMQNFGERSVESVSLEGESDVPEIDFYERLSIDTNIQFGNQFLVRNSEYLDMEFALGGEVNLLKEYSGELQMFGTLEGLRGYARPLGKEFELDEAQVSFYGPVDNPDLNIRTLYEPPEAAGITIYYMIEGSLEEPEFNFESDPQLELQDIIGYTLFGKPFYELESWEQVIAGSGSSPSASDYAIDVLLDRVELLASDRLGIDVVQIDNTRSGSSNSTAIKTGWYLNQNTFFAILNEVGGARPKTLFILEYMLRDNLELILTQGDDSREGVDLKWQLDY